MPSKVNSGSSSPSRSVSAAPFELLGEQRARSSVRAERGGSCRTCRPGPRADHGACRRRRGAARTPRRRGARARSRARRSSDRSRPVAARASCPRARRLRPAAGVPEPGQTGTGSGQRSPAAGGRAAARPRAAAGVTAQSSRQPTTPSRWLKLRGRERGREPRKSSSSAGVSWSSQVDALLVGEARRAAAARPPRS